MHLKVRRDRPPTTDPTQHFPCRGLLGCSFRHRYRQLSPSKPRRGEGGGSRRLRVPLPPAPLTSGGAAALPSINAPCSGCRGAPAPQSPPRRGPGWAAGGFGANLFKREAAEGSERQGSAFLHQSTGRNTHVAIPFSGGSSTSSAFDNLSSPPPPPPQPALALSIPQQLH